MADKVLGLCDSSGWAKLNSVCFLWQESVPAVRWYAMLISYGCLKEKKSHWSASSKGLAITTRPKFQYFLKSIFKPQLTETARRFWEDQTIGPGTMAGTSSLEGHPACQPKIRYSQTTQELRKGNEENADILKTEINDRCSYLN